MKVPDSLHRARPWRIHELVEDFELLDAWALPTPGGPDDFPRLIDLFASFDPARSTSPMVRSLFAIRERLGGLLGLDDDTAGLGTRVTPVGDRLPSELRSTFEASFNTLPVSPLYLTDDEFAVEIANRTVHGVIHFGWVHAEGETYRGEMAIYIKRNGLLGTAYMAAITPFRHLLVYPRLMRDIEGSWAESRRAPV
jgi:Protein of unknown function (DUF2867)